MIGEKRMSSHTSLSIGACSLEQQLEANFLPPLEI